MIKVEQLCRNYGDFAAVRNVSFQIKPGEIVGLLGHNGAGKTTIMKMLMGFLEPSGGHIHIDGKPLQENSLALRGQMGYLPESPPVYPEMSVCDYLDYAAHLRGVSASERAVSVRYAIQRTDLRDKALDSISTLSRGYRQRVGVAQALLSKPRILILDEPTNGLDPSQIEHMRELIREMRSHSTVILSTHIMQEVSATCDRVLMIRQGELALDSGIDELQRSQQLYLRTNATEQAIRSALKGLDAIEKIEATLSKEEKSAFNIKIIESESPENFAPEVARRLVQEEITIFALSPEKRDLETVFKEVNQSSEVADAA